MSSHRRNDRTRDPVPVHAIAAHIARERDERRKQRGGKPTGEEAARLARRAAYEAATADPRNHVEVPPEAVQRRVRRTALVPTILSVPCEVHGSPAGEYCFTTAHGVCAERIKARAALR